MDTCRSMMVLAVSGGLLVGCGQEPTFQGTALDPPRAAYDFTLKDPFGKRVRLAEFKGRVVVLTFLYTSCPDLCPLVTEKLRKTIEALGEQASDVAVLAVTVDPERDTAERVQAFSQQHGMVDRWQFLIGDAKALQPIWEYYWVGKVWSDTKGNVMHQSPVHLIDRQGKIRVVHGSSFEPAMLAHDIRMLFKG